MTIERWISGIKATATDWYDKRNLYFEVECYRPGQSMSQPPAWSKAFLLPIENWPTVQNFFDSVTNALAMENDTRKMLSKYVNGKCVVRNGVAQ